MDYISYEQFGVHFVRRAVTAERIAESLTDTASGDIDVGPDPVGPGGIATATARGTVGTIRVTPGDGDLLSFAAVIPIELDLEVKIGPLANRFKALVEVPLGLTVRTADPLFIVIDVAPVVPRDIRVDLRPTSLGGDVLQSVGNMEAELQARVAHTVNERMMTEESQRVRIIDVAEQIERTS